ncbi:hypothetical protein XENOCAPTIV_003855, partial [Xenoophorus captivus]
HIHSRSALECAYRTHLIAGVGFYQHLLLYIQSHYQLELQDCIDWTHVTDPLIGEISTHEFFPKQTHMELWINLEICCCGPHRPPSGLSSIAALCFVLFLTSMVLLGIWIAAPSLF